MWSTSSEIALEVVSSLLIIIEATIINSLYHQHPLKKIVTLSFPQIESHVYLIDFRKELGHLSPLNAFMDKFVLVIEYSIEFMMCIGSQAENRDVILIRSQKYILLRFHVGKETLERKS